MKTGSVPSHPGQEEEKGSEKIAERNITQEKRNRGPLVRSPGVRVKRGQGQREGQSALHSEAGGGGGWGGLS